MASLNLRVANQIVHLCSTSGLHSAKLLGISPKVAPTSWFTASWPREALDAEHQGRGLLVAEIICQKVSEKRNLPLVVVAPLAASQEGILAWARENLTAPSGIYLFPRDPEACCVEEGEEYMVAKTGRARIVSRRDAMSGWA